MSYTAIIIVGIVAILAAAAIVVFIVYMTGYSNAVFNYCFTRANDKLGRSKWGRACSDPTNKDLYSMWEQEEAWTDANRTACQELRVVISNTKLAARYFNFGYKNAVIIVPGIHETSTYGAYYANVFKENGFNCLLVDPRSTGLSEGDYNTAGFMEKEDVLAWAKELRDNQKAEDIVLMGLSTGAAACVLAEGNDTVPSYIKALILDSCYADFKEFFKNYMLSCEYKLHAYKSSMNKLAKCAGVVYEETAPITAAPKVKIPVLFLTGGNDKIVSTEESKNLFDAFGSEDKETKTIENAGHTYLRYTNPEDYDETIKAFLEKRFTCDTSIPSTKETTSRGYTFANRKIRRLQKTEKNTTT